MLCDPQRETIHQLHHKGLSIRQIARTLGHSRNTVRRVLKHAQSPRGGEPHALTRRAPQLAAQLPELFAKAKGNVVRIQELIAEQQGQYVPYSTLTLWVRQAQLREPTKHRVGHYAFAPGEEMQHDTSPHRLELAGQRITAQCAALVLGYSRYAFIQYYPRFTRFEARVFLQAAFSFFGGVCRRCTIDNTSVLVASGTGPGASIAAPIERLGEQFGVRFVPHAVGHADRKAHVERLFYYVQNNFLAARSFNDWTELNAKARRWCETVANQKIKRSLGTSPRAVFEQERPFLLGVPTHLPPVYELHHRVVDTGGFVHLDTNRYSVPERLIGAELEVYKYNEAVVICRRGREIARHRRVIAERNRRVTAPGHHHPAASAQQRPRGAPSPLHQALLTDAPAVLADYVQALGRHTPAGGSTARLKRLLTLKRAYPTEPFLGAVEQALAYGLYDMARLESLILKRVRGEFFHLKADD